MVQKIHVKLHFLTKFTCAVNATCVRLANEDDTIYIYLPIIWIRLLMLIYIP